MTCPECGYNYELGRADEKIVMEAWGMSRCWNCEEKLGMCTCTVDEREKAYQRIKKNIIENCKLIRELKDKIEQI